MFLLVVQMLLARSVRRVFGNTCLSWFVRYSIDFIYSMRSSYVMIFESNVDPQTYQNPSARYIGLSSKHVKPCHVLQLHHCVT
jgi:hypothetical protein